MAELAGSRELLQLMQREDQRLVARTCTVRDAPITETSSGAGQWRPCDSGVAQYIDLAHTEQLVPLIATEPKPDDRLASGGPFT